MPRKSKFTPVLPPKSTQRIAKVEFQQRLQNMRNAGYTVHNLDTGYEVKMFDDVLMRAMRGRDEYIVTFNRNFMRQTA